MSLRRALTCCLAFSALPVHGATFHVLLVADTNDVAIGEGARENDRKLKKWFTQAATGLQMTLDIHPIEGAEFSCESINSSIQKLTAEPVRQVPRARHLLMTIGRSEMIWIGKVAVTPEHEASGR
jgi:hypothetical protein